MLLEHEDAVRVTTRRARLDKIDDDGTQQLVDFRGLKNEVLQKVWRPMEFGYFSMPPKDSDGVMIQMGSRADRTLYY
ncbi:MAG: phage baseplate assembly protein, partial [Bradyrhizobium sp.]